MTQLSTKAWNLAKPMIRAIKAQPFNQELMNGTLPLHIFGGYLELDRHYLQTFTQCHTILASKAPSRHIPTFLYYADEAFIAEQEQVHQFFKRHFNLKESNLTTPALIGYSNYLLRTASFEPVEVGIAAALPCFWIYREVGVSMHQTAKSDNPFKRWIDTYADVEFGQCVSEMIDIFDDVGQFASPEIQRKMLDAFLTSTCWEKKFWEDAYHQTEFNPLSTLSTSGVDKKQSPKYKSPFFAGVQEETASMHDEKFRIK